MGHTSVDATPSEGTGFNLVPGIVLPGQFRPRTIATPEKRLLLAVLEHAVATYHRHSAATDRRGRRLLHEVEQWFASDETGWLFAFASICHTLDLDVTWVRSHLGRRREGQRAPASRPAA